MSKFLLLALPLTLALFSACQPDTQTAETQESTAVEDVAETVIFDASCNAENGNSPDSNLRAKLAKLTDSKYNYGIVEQGPVDINKSNFFELQRLSKSDWYRVDFEIIGLENLLSQMTQAEFSRIKGSVDLGGHFYPRATVDEYIFKTEDCAKTAEAYLNWANNYGPWSAGINKAPNRVIRDGQSVYYLIGNGTYMVDRIAEIESALKL